MKPFLYERIHAFIKREFVEDANLITGKALSIVLRSRSKDPVTRIMTPMQCSGVLNQLEKLGVLEVVGRLYQHGTDDDARGSKGAKVFKMKEQTDV